MVMLILLRVTHTDYLVLKNIYVFIKVNGVYAGLGSLDKFFLQVIFCSNGLSKSSSTYSYERQEFCDVAFFDRIKIK